MACRVRSACIQEKLESIWTGFPPARCSHTLQRGYDSINLMADTCWGGNKGGVDAVMTPG